MAISYLERLATQGTGRLGAESARPRRGRLVVYPSYISYDELIRLPGERDTQHYYIEYEPVTWRSLSMVTTGLRLLMQVMRVLPRSDEIFLVRCNRTYDAFGTFLTAITARLAGVPVILCDYSFSSRHYGKGTRRLYSLCRRLELGDTSGLDKDGKAGQPVSFRIDTGDLSAYRAYTKPRSVPSVLVYGDFDDSTTRLLVTRTYDLIKQKYPRTEFRLVAPAAVGLYETPDDRSNGSFLFCYPRTEEDMMELFSEVDTVMLVSSGGINRHFITRASAAEYPVIGNGLEYPGSSELAVITVPRGSYSGLADAVISLVDDETYYRSFHTE